MEGAMATFTTLTARRKAVRKKCLKQYPGEKMLWFGGVLYFVDEHNKPVSMVPPAKILAKSDKDYGLLAARKEPTPRVNVTPQKIVRDKPSNFRRSLSSSHWDW
jgi:hypothetical protein